MIFDNSDTVPQGIQVNAPQHTAPKLTVQWGSGGESRITQDHMDAIAEAIDRCRPGEYRSLFPIHEHWGALSLGVDGTTVWLYTNGGAFVAGELVDPSIARPRGVPASGVVDIGKLAPDVQAAISHLLKQAQRR